MRDLDYLLDREERIRKSNIRNIYTPHTPIKDIHLLKGRNVELHTLIEQLSTPGLHALLYGERGIGKSSLANVVVNELARITRRKLFIKRCSSSDNFSTIVDSPLKEAGYNINDINISKTSKIGFDFNTLSVKKDHTTLETGSSLLSISPSWVADCIEDIEGLLLIDEFDAITNTEDKYKIAELIKLLSDKNSKIKILIVGVAMSATELTAGHPSITRCLREIKLKRLRPIELKKVIEDGAKEAKIMFTSSSISKIVFVSSGYPYFTHLLALKAAEEAIANDQTVITLKNLSDATYRAVQDAEGSLKSSYDTSVNFQNKEEYERILLAASRCREEGFSTKDLKDEYLRICKENITSQKLSGYLGKIVSFDGSKILRRICKGYYRFSDPRMPSFVKIARAYFDE